MCGVDIDALLDGAERMDRRCSSESLEDNPAAMLATLLVRLGREKNKPNHILMPYSSAMDLFADWYRQLWAESLGKRHTTTGDEIHAGFTPIKALGATDQHSQIQLYREGPNDKVIGFVDIEKHAADVPIPAGANVANLKYLEGASLAALLRAEKRATEYALVESRRPNFTITMPTLDAAHVGEFIQLWMVATAYAGRLLDVDAYNQPAVETGKKATFGLMGRAGFEEYKAQVDQTLSPTRFTV
jgi:glucose-6-phosphate isomerase